MSFYNNHVGCNLTENKLQVVEINFKENHFTLGNVDEEPLGEPLNFDDAESKFISILQSSFDSLTERKSLTSDYISFSLPINIFKLAKIPIEPSLTKSDLTDYINWELSLLFPSKSTKEYTIQKIKISEEESEENYVLIIAVETRILKYLHKFSVRNNLNLKFVNNAHITSDSLILLNHPKFKSKSFFSIYIDENVFSISLHKNNLLQFIRIRKFSSLPELIPLLITEIESLSQFQINPFNVDGSFIFGNLKLDDIQNSIAEATELKLSVINPFDKINPGEDFNQLDFYLNKANSFSAAAGIAFRLT